MGGGLSIFHKKEPKPAYEVAKGKSLAGPINIYFASATGKSEKFAKALTRELASLGFDADYFNLNEYKESEILGCTRALFLASSSGDGQAPFECRPFLEWIKNDKGGIAAAALSAMSFSVFGLGNMEYRYYNKCGLDLDKYLEALGGTRLMEIGLGDDSNGNLDDDYDLWNHKIVNKLMVKFHPRAASLGYSEEIVSTTGSSKIPGKVRTDFRTVTLTPEEVLQMKPRPLTEVQMDPTNQRFFTAQALKVLVNRELRTEDPGSSTRHLELDLTGSGLTYQTADNVAILPQNKDATVARVAVALQYDLSEVFRLQPKQMSAKASAQRQVAIKPLAEPFPTPCSVRECLKHYVDLTGVLSQSLLLQFYPYVEDAAQKTWLKDLVAKDKKAEFKEWVVTKRPTLAELLCKELSSARIPLADLLHLVPFLQPRFYTLASSSSQHPSTLHICCGWSENAGGLCSSLLYGLAPGDMIRAFVQESTFRLPADAAAPITMIGPGTGIAPMRALLQERHYQTTQGAKVGSNTLYFGCKNSQQDYIYRDELEDYRDNKKILTKLHLAFSREDPKKKVYVQHLLAQEDNAKALVADLDKGGYIYVCGSTSMGKDVMETIRGVLVRLKGLGADPAQALLDKMVENGSYVQELWG